MSTPGTSLPYLLDLGRRRQDGAPTYPPRLALTDIKALGYALDALLETVRPDVPEEAEVDYETALTMLEDVLAHLGKAVDAAESCQFELPFAHSLPGVASDRRERFGVLVE